MKKHLILKAVLTIVSVILIVTAYTGAIDKTGMDYSEKTLTRSLIVFGIARGINGVISVAQGTEISFQPVGVGVNFTPGEILDPVNDLIERFSMVMLISSSSIGIQKVLLDMCRWSFFTYAFIFLQILFIITLWMNHKVPEKFNNGLARLMLILI